MTGFILEQVKLGMPLFSAQKEENGEQRLLSTKPVCVWYMYMCLGGGWSGFFGFLLPKSGCLQEPFCLFMVHLWHAVNLMMT